MTNLHNLIEFRVYGRPQPAGSKKAFVVDGKPLITDSNKNAKPWMQEVAGAAIQAINTRTMPVFTGPVLLSVTFYLKRPKMHYKASGELKDGAPEYPIQRPDSTKLLRCAEDALSGVMWKDDSQVVQQAVSKEFGEPEGCRIIVWALGDGS